MCVFLLRFNKYKVVVINGLFWENQGQARKIIFSNRTYWIVLGHFEPDSNFHNYYNLKK